MEQLLEPAVKDRPSLLIARAGLPEQMEPVEEYLLRKGFTRVTSDFPDYQLGLGQYQRREAAASSGGRNTRVVLVWREQHSL